MPVSQAQFDQDLAAFVAASNALDTSVEAYIAAVTAFLQNPQVVDLAAEDASVNTLLQAVNTTQADVTTAQGALPPPPPGPAKPAA